MNSIALSIATTTVIGIVSYCAYRYWHGRKVVDLSEENNDANWYERPVPKIAIKKCHKITISRTT